MKLLRSALSVFILFCLLPAALPAQDTKSSDPKDRQKAAKQLGERGSATDIPVLAEHFMARAAETSGLPVRRLSPEALALLQSAEWPGNVRQLRNVVEWLLIMAPGDAKTEIGVESLPPDFVEAATAGLNPTANGELMVLPIREAREHFERAYLQAQLERFSGNISRTAGFVGMERSALHRKLKSLNISADG